MIFDGPYNLISSWSAKQQGISVGIVTTALHTVCTIHSIYSCILVVHTWHQPAQHNVHLYALQWCNVEPKEVGHLFLYLSVQTCRDHFEIVLTSFKNNFTMISLCNPFYPNLFNYPSDELNHSWIDSQISEGRCPIANAETRCRQF